MSNRVFVLDSPGPYEQLHSVTTLMGDGSAVVLVRKSKGGVVVGEILTQDLDPDQAEVWLEGWDSDSHTLHEHSLLRWVGANGSMPGSLQPSGKG